ncbi:MAG: polysaccharide deacetylase family protein [Thermincolia bacterium]
MTKGKVYLLIGFTTLVLGVVFTLQKDWFPWQVVKKPPVTDEKSNLSVKSQHHKTVPEAVKEGKIAKTIALSTTKEGWGFRKNKEHRIPEITAHQKELVDKYGIYFVANNKNKVVVLTFDLGYEKGYTGRILDILDKHQVKAIFFITGPWLKENPQLAKRIIKEGHVIGNHTWSHPSLPNLDKNTFMADIKKLEDAIVETTGQSRSIKYLRPPMGEYSEKTLQWTNELGYITVLWSIALRDWLPMGGPDKAVTGVVENLHNGAIILLHGVSQDVTEGLDQILRQINATGYKVIPIDRVKI